MENLRYLIREVLKEELDKLKEKTKSKNSPVKEEEVIIQSSLDLNNFAKRIMKMSQDPKINSELRTGKHIFRLSNNNQQPLVEAHQPISKMSRDDHNIIFEGGIITLRDVETLTKNTKVVTVSNSTHCTPLALDEMKRRNIKIEREIK